MPHHVIMPGDWAERTAALTELTRSMLVEAGAGTGKTSIMAGRAVMLMAAGVPPAEIVAVSYTEFSASELRDRITRFTAAVASGRPPADLRPGLPGGIATAQQVANLERAANDLDRMSCTTIHGFCRSLLTPYPVEAAIDPGAAVLDQGAADLLFEDVRKAWLRTRLAGPQREGDDFVALYLADEKETRRLLDGCADHMRANRRMRVADFPQLDGELAALRGAVVAFRAFLVSDCTDCCPERIAEIVAALELQVAAMPPDDTEQLLMWAVSLRVPAVCATAEDEFNSEKRACTKKMWQEAGGARFPKVAADRLHGLAVTRYVAVRDAHNALRNAASGRALRIVAAEAESLLARYTEAKRQAAALDFNDLIESTRLLLANRPEVRRALAAQFSAILVDEFQDTDPQQAEILWRLCGEPPPGEPDASWDKWAVRPGALFLVGDPKQSIYRFRGGDLATYQRAAVALERDPAAAIVRISRNFRSRACILDHVNDWFQPVFTGGGGQAGFTPLATEAHDPLDPPGVAVLRLVADPDAPAQGTRDAEAELVARVCRRLVGNFMVRGADGSVGPCEPGDIALLTPTGTQLWRYERALEEAGISVAPQAGKGFFRRQEVQDLIALTRALADTRDRLALGALLRGPLVGMADRDLLDAVEAQAVMPGRTPQMSLGMDFARIANSVLRNVLERLHALGKMRNAMTPHILLERAVDELRVRPVLRQRGGRNAERALANADLFLELARPYHLRGLKAFADDMRSQWEDAQRALDARPDMDRRSVSLLTMHSAKGLEWPVVIIVNTAGKIDTSVDVASDRGDGLFHMKAFGRHPEGSEAAALEEKRQCDLERERLWWVATTRARDLLLMPDPAQQVTAPAWVKAVAFPLDGLPSFAHDHLAEHDLFVPDGGHNWQDATAFGSEADAIRDSIPAILRVTPSRHEGGGDEADVGDDDPGAPAAGEVPRVEGAGRVRGVVLHKLLEEVLGGALPDAEETLTARGAVLLAQLGIAVREGPDPAEMASAVRRGLAVPEVAAVRARVQPEWPTATSALTDDGKEMITSGAADAVALEPDGTVSLVVDWKSDVAPTPEAKNRYRIQIRDYLASTNASQGLLVFLTTGEAEAVHTR